MKFQKIKQKGMTLLELMIVIAIGMTIAVVFFLAIPKLQAKSRTSTESQHITMIASGIKSQYASAQSMATLSNAVLLNSKIVPDDMKIQGTNIYNVWNGSVVIQPNATSNLRYDIIYSGVPRAECSSLSVAVSGNFLKFSINGTVIFDRTVTGGNIDIDPSAVAAACVDGETNVLTFVGN